MCLSGLFSKSSKQPDVPAIRISEHDPEKTPLTSKMPTGKRKPGQRYTGNYPKLDYSKQNDGPSWAGHGGPHGGSGAGAADDGSATFWGATGYAYAHSAGMASGNDAGFGGGHAAHDGSGGGSY